MMAGDELTEHHMQFLMEEAPSGMIARGDYKVKVSYSGIMLFPKGFPSSTGAQHNF